MFPGDDRQDEAMRALGRYVAGRREALGLSQEDLADDLGASQGFISNIERGKRTNIPTLDELDALARALHCDVTDLLAAAGYLQRRPAAVTPEDDAAVFTSLMRGVNRLTGVTDHDKRIIQMTVDVVRRAAEAERRRNDD